MFGRKKYKSVGLVLGGGGARGLAHFGVIRAFLEHGIVFDKVAGCSAGSVAAAMYSAGADYAEMYQAATTLRKEDIFTSKLFFVPSDPKRMEGTVKKLLGERDDFSKTQIPLYILAVDIVAGEEYIFTKGPISRAAAASCAVPGLFAPVPMGDMLLMDGGLMNNIPASVLRDLGCDAVVAVEVNDMSKPVAKSGGVIDVLMASIKILIRANSMKGVKASDIVVRPNVSKYKFTDPAGADEMIEEGYRAAMEHMASIKELLGS
jgi:NTE family protein